MPAVSAVATFPGTVHEAETVWYETDRWPLWVDGLERVENVAGAWPEVGGGVTWESGPAGRGRVTERVIEYEALGGQTVRVEDDSIRGRQSVAFTPEDEGVSISLNLEYEIKERSLFTRLVDVLFIRSAFRHSIESTLQRFGLELEAARAAGGR